MAWFPPNTKGKTVHHYHLPAWWSVALLNNDRTSLALDAEDLAEFEEWAGQNTHLLNPVSCSDESFLGRWNGLTCDLLTYTYLED